MCVKMISCKTQICKTSNGAECLGSDLFLWSLHGAFSVETCTKEGGNYLKEVCFQVKKEMI